MGHAADEFEDALASARREARGAFGDDRVILERYVETPRHIEVQVFGDQQGDVVHLFERDCSSQRRYQKVIEEAPAPGLTETQRDALTAAAVQAARAVDYQGAGTVEFIVDGTDASQFFFMEMNTRLQVEHPVTEMVTGLDLVEWQLRVAAGEPLPLAQDDIHLSGHAFEARLYAEDPARNFLPGSGRLERLVFPAGSDTLRIETGVREGDVISVHYDPMIAKLVSHGHDRDAALATLENALQHTAAIGPSSNVGFLQRLAALPRFRRAEMHTAYLDRHLDEVLADRQEAGPLTALAGALAARAREPHADEGLVDPWDRLDGWRIGGTPAPRNFAVNVADQAIELTVHGHGDHVEVGTGDHRRAVEISARDGHEVMARVDGEPIRATVFRSGRSWQLAVPGDRVSLTFQPRFAERGAAAVSEHDVVAPMPGKVIELRVTEGDRVEEGQKLIVMEAMKMELTLRAPHAGVVADLPHAVGEFVEADTLLAHIEPEGDE